MAARPNIVYLMFDQCRSSAAPNSDYVTLPFLRHLVSTGFVFSHAYANAPVCNPSRTSVHTGVHPLVHQVTCNQNWAPHNLPQLAELLGDAGYLTMVAGHYDGHQNLSRGWDMQTRSTDTGGLKRAYEAWLRAVTDPVPWRSGTRPGPDTDGHAYRLTSRMLQMIEIAVDDGAPFFAHLCLEAPHNPYTVPSPWDESVDPAGVRLPDRGDGPLKPPWQYRVWDESQASRATDDDVRRMIATYHGMVAYAESQMARLYASLGRLGALDNTWIIVSSDHGDYLGEKGMFAKTESLYECLLHVPLIIRPPGGARGNHRPIDQLVELVDLFPTILSMAGVPVPHYAQGHDLLAGLDGRAEPLRDHAFAQVGEYHGSLGNTYPAGMPATGRHSGLLEGVRTIGHSYMRDPDNGDEAYDLRADPFELANLLQDHDHPEPAPIADLKRSVDDWHERCVNLRTELGIRPGPRGFDFE